MISVSRCILCDSTDISHVATVTPGYDVYHCAGCHFEWVSRSSIKDIELNQLYQNYPYNQNIHTTHARMRSKYIDGFRKRIGKYYSLDEVSQLSFLDVGCANGEYLDVANSLNFRKVVGVEIDQNAAKIARQYGIVVEDIRELDYKFDIIQIKNVLTNIENFHNFLETYLEHLNPNGILFIDVLNQGGLTSMVRKLLFRTGRELARYGTLRPPHVINGFTASSIKVLFEKHFLELLDMRQTYYGSNYIPYGDKQVVKWLGFTSYVIGLGSMLIFDVRKKNQ